MSNSGLVGRQYKRPIKYQPPFGGASEVVVEDRKGEAESPELDRPAAAVTTTTSQVETTPLEEQSSSTGIDASGAATGGTAAVYEDSKQSVRWGSTASGRFGDSLPPSMLSLGPLSRPVSVHAPSPHSYQGRARSVARLAAQRASATEDDDEMIRTISVIPSAAVISTAVAAVSADWFESDALAATMASPGLTRTSPGSTSSPGMAPTTSEISPKSSSPRNNRSRHDSRVSMTSNFRASQYLRQGSVEEGGYMGSGGNSNSVYSNQGVLTASGSATSMLVNPGAPGSGGHKRRVVNNRTNMASVTNNNSNKCLSTSAQALLSTSPNSPNSSSPIARNDSILSVIAPLVTYSASADDMANSPIEPQLQPQQEQSQRP
ncbi:hypothetical protein BG015_002418 [Linnemannia schmuckeri]|uniref:Uncharacterized protein n=1 Tax=Linnemannia schmuckeri TaxID=64567 RepID=A0A9P5S312_9FUNG|nr:hypothetical protein BG015_002418 [Linnemannia schmuckeri]